MIFFFFWFEITIFIIFFYIYEFFFSIKWFLSHQFSFFMFLSLPFTKKNNDIFIKIKSKFNGESNFINRL